MRINKCTNLLGDVFIEKGNGNIIVEGSLPCHTFVLCEGGCPGGHRGAVRSGGQVGVATNQAGELLVQRCSILGVAVTKMSNITHTHIYMLYPTSFTYFPAPMIQTNDYKTE